MPSIVGFPWEFRNEGAHETICCEYVVKHSSAEAGKDWSRILLYCIGEQPPG